MLWLEAIRTLEEYNVGQEKMIGSLLWSVHWTAEKSSGGEKQKWQQCGQKNKGRTQAFNVGAILTWDSLGTFCLYAASFFSI